MEKLDRNFIKSHMAFEKGGYVALQKIDPDMKKKVLLREGLGRNT